MSDQENSPQVPTETPNQQSEMDSKEAPRQVFQMSDDMISMIREVVQLSLLTGTNLVDHLRAMQVEPTTVRPDRLTVTPEYVQAYNQMVTKLNEAVEAQRKLMQQSAAIEE